MRMSAASDPPPVSCICLTYGRPEVLEEAVYSFLQQDYAGPKELVVLNDHGGQILEFEHSEVRVVNVPVRFRTLGEKRNAALALAAHDLIFVWDDDDIHLPHRISFSVRSLDPKKGFYRPSGVWRKANGAVFAGTFHGAACWSRRLFDRVRGYPAESNGEDRFFDERLQARFPDRIGTTPIRPEEIFYIYRWGGTDSYHISGYGDRERGKNGGYAEVEAFVRKQVAEGWVLEGQILLKPHWKEDYPRLVAEAMDPPAPQPASPKRR